MSYTLKEHMAWMKDGDFSTPGRPDRPDAWCFSGEEVEDRYVRTFIHTYIRTYAHACVLSYIRTYAHTYVHAYIRSYIRTFVRTYIFAWRE